MTAAETGERLHSSGLRCGFMVGYLAHPMFGDDVRVDTVRPEGNSSTEEEEEETALDAEIAAAQQASREEAAAKRARDEEQDALLREIFHVVHGREGGHATRDGNCLPASIGNWHEMETSKHERCRPGWQPTH